MNNFLIINNKCVTTVKGLKSCFNQPEATVSNSSLFIELIDKFVDGDIENFLLANGEDTLAEKIKGITIVDSDSELMRELIAAMTEEVVKVDFDPLEYIKVEKTDIVLSDDDKWKAIIDYRIIKQAIEEVEFIIKQNNQVGRDRLQLMKNKIGQLRRLSMCIMPEDGLVEFYVGSKKIDELYPTRDLFFNVNGVSFVMKFVEGGAFWMGAQSINRKAQNYDDEAGDDESFVHRVTLSNYYMGETVVTQALWKAVMKRNSSVWRGDNLPMENVSWNDCQVFISKLNSLTGKNFRLPTEAEWEYAARGGMKSNDYKYAGSNKIMGVAWYDDNSGGKTHRVKGKSPNELDLYDMSGNVEEWCSDWYGNYGSGPKTNPKGPSSGYLRVTRGGTYRDCIMFSRVSFRSHMYPDKRDSCVGFRLCLPY